MKLTTLAAGAAMTLALVAAGAANAGLTGDTVSADYAWPNVGTVLYPSGTAVVGAGVEFNNIGGFGVGVSPAVDFSDSNIRVTYPGGWALGGSGTFDGWVFTDFSAGTTITGASLDATNIFGLTAGMVSFDAHHVFANTLGLGGWHSDAFISIDVATGGGVPEPASWALMLVGFGGLGAALRASHRRMTATA